MSQIIAKIEDIESVASLNIVRFSCAGQILQMVSLELSDAMRQGRSVTLACKPTSVALAKPAIPLEDFSAMLSYSNQLNVEIVSIEQGALLSSVMLRLGEFMLESITSTESIDRLGLKEGDRVLALIKANELSILEVRDA